MSNLYMFGRRQDYCFQKNNHGFNDRDHLRVWRTAYRDGRGLPWWAVAATRDVGIELADGLPTHRIGDDVDAERELVLRDLLKTGQVTRNYRIMALECGYFGTNGGHDPYYTDGEVVVLDLADGL